MIYTTLPDIAAVVDSPGASLLGRPYAEYDCWRLLRYMVSEGFGIELPPDQNEAWRHVSEIWFRTDEEDPFALIQPWDLLIFRTMSRASKHVGVVFDAMQFVHTRERFGVCLEPLQRWRKHLLQIARLQQLL